MSGNYWIKLYIEIIDDPKMATLPDRLWRRVIELFLLAGQMGESGLLPTTSQLAWLLRMATDDLELDMQQLSNTGIVEAIPNGWNIPKFKERQAPIPTSIRVKEYREKMKQQQYYQDDVTNRYENVTQINRLTDNRLTDIDDRLTETEQNVGVTENIFKIYSDNVAPLTQTITEKLKLDEDEYGTIAVKDAIKEAVFRNKRSMGYIEAILRNQHERELKRQAHERAGG